MINCSLISLSLTFELFILRQKVNLMWTIFAVSWLPAINMHLIGMRILFIIIPFNTYQNANNANLSISILRQFARAVARPCG